MGILIFHFPYKCTLVKNNEQDQQKAEILVCHFLHILVTPWGDCFLESRKSLNNSSPMFVYVRLGLSQFNEPKYKLLHYLRSLFTGGKNPKPYINESFFLNVLVWA